MSTFQSVLLLFFLTIQTACQSGKPLKEKPSPLVEDALTQAESLFTSDPRTRRSVTRAYELVTKLLNQSDPKDQDRYEALTQAAKYATWLAYHAQEKEEISHLALEVVGFCDEAVRLDNAGVEGYYFRGIATGLYAQQNKFRGRQAMIRIRNDALKAIELDPGFQRAGPHRLLGALYLRAPGPPMGIGSQRKAVKHLERAFEIAPEYPENLLFLAELYLKMGQQKQARELLEKVMSSSHPDGFLMGQKEWRREAGELKQKLGKSSDKR